MESLNQISKIKNIILDKTLQASLVFFAMLFMTNLFRVYQYGLDFVNVGFIIIIFSAFVVIFNKKKLNYYFKFNFFLGIQLLAFTLGLISFGIIGGNFFFLISAVICSAIFGFKKTTLFVLVSGITVFIIFMILYLNHIVELRFNLENYSYKLSNWLTLIFAGLMVIIMLKTIVEELLGKIEKINTDLEKQNAEVKLLNDSLENKVNERTEDLYRTNKEKDRILGVIAHDVNNRIGGIATLLDMVQNQELNAEEEKEFIKLACDTCFSTVDIIRDLLEYSKNIGDQTELFLEQVNLNDFIRSSVELYKLNAHKKSVKINVNEPQSSIFCKLNKLKFSRVMDNLISNAIKFSLPDGKIEISCYEENNKVYISIKDNGIGIPDNIKDKIFIPFSGAGRVGTNKEESNGLGLSIVKNIVEKHQGKIWFESVKNQGTTFYICLTSK